jgi:hypothetical protein
VREQVSVRTKCVYKYLEKAILTHVCHCLAVQKLLSFQKEQMIMDTQIQQAESSDRTTKEDIKAFQGSELGTLAMLQQNNETAMAWERFSKQVSNFLAQLPEYIGSFFNEYRLLVISFALLVTVIIILRLVLAIINAINGIPLLNLLLELVGMGYAIWFTFRYLIKASTRQELAAELNSIRKQITGGEISEPSS